MIRWLRHARSGTITKHQHCLLPPGCVPTRGTANGCEAAPCRRASAKGSCWRNTSHYDADPTHGCSKKRPPPAKISLGSFFSAIRGCPVVKVYSTRLSAIAAFAWSASPSWYEDDVVAGTGLHGLQTFTHGKVCQYGSLCELCRDSKHHRVRVF